MLALESSLFNFYHFIICLGVDLFGVNFFRALCASYILISVFFRLGKFSDIISSNMFSIPFSSPSGIPVLRRLVLFILSHRSLILLSCFFIGFSVCCPDWVTSVIISSKSLIHSSASFLVLFSIFKSAWVSTNEFSNLFFLAPPYIL